jgi:large subunit ribosomal protein L25
MQIEFTAKKRDVQGTGASRRLRHAGRIPGIVYGEATTPQMIDMDHNELFQLMRKEAFYSSVLTLNLDGAKELCLLRDVQRHPYKQIIMHLDFQRIDATHKLHQKVPLHFVNADVAPGVKLGGGLVSHAMNEVDVKCLPADLPAFIEVDLKDLQAGQSIHVSQLSLPKGVEVVHHGHGDPVVASITVKGGGAKEEEAPVAAAPAAPEKKAEKKSEKTDKR